MKRFLPICLLIVLVAAACISGCTMRETSSAVPTEQQPESTPAPSAQPTAEPTPTPSPIPFDLVADNAEPRYKWLSGYDELFDAYDALRSAEGLYSGQDSPAFSGAAVSDITDHGDIMARNGEILYILSDKDLVVAQLAGEGTRELSRTSIGIDWTNSDNGAAVTGREKTPVELFTAGDRLAVLYDWYGYDSLDGSLQYTEYLAVEIFDVTDPAAPQRMTELGQGGALYSAGINDGCLYVITEYTGYEESDRTNLNGYVPAVFSGGVESTLPAEKICLAQDGAFPGCSVIGIYDLDQPRCVDVQALAGVAADACSEDSLICFFSSRQTESLSRIWNTDGGVVTETAEISCTDLFRFHFDKDALVLTLAETVNGIIRDGGCLDFNDGQLLALTQLQERLYTDSTDDSLSWDKTTEGSALYVFDENLKMIGKFTPAEETEFLRWAGFLGERVILSDPESSRSYLVSVDGGDEPVKLSDCINADALLPWGESGLATFRQDGSGRLILTVYDDSLAQMDQRSFGSDYSNTLENIKGYYSDGERNIISFSADDSYCFYGISDQGKIDHRLDFYLDDWAWNARVFCFGEHLYVADRNEILVLDPADLTELTRITL